MKLRAIGATWHALSGLVTDGRNPVGAEWIRCGDRVAKAFGINSHVQFLGLEP